MVQQTTDGFWQAEPRSEETKKFISNVYSHQKWDTLVTSHDCTF